MASHRRRREPTILDHAIAIIDHRIASLRKQRAELIRDQDRARRVPRRRIAK